MSRVSDADKGVTMRNFLFFLLVWDGYSFGGYGWYVDVCGVCGVAKCDEECVSRELMNEKEEVKN